MDSILGFGWLKKVNRGLNWSLKLFKVGRLENEAMMNMMTSSNGNISVLLAICAGNSPIPGEFPAHRPVTRSFDAFFDLRLNKRLGKQSWDWWFETPSCPLWRHSNDKKQSNKGISY